jgi:hypothetical protein
MMSPERLEAVVINAIIDGKNADQVSKQTGVPVQRVQLAMHKARGKDPAEANRASRKNRRQKDRALFGTTLGGPRQLGPNRSRGRRSR